MAKEKEDNIETKEETRTEALIRKLLSQKELIDSADKGELVINFAGKSVTVSIKMFV